MTSEEHAARLLGTYADAETVALALEYAERCDYECGGDERHAACGYLLMREAGTPYEVIFAIDLLRRARRTRH